MIGVRNQDVRQGADLRHPLRDADRHRNRDIGADIPISVSIGVAQWTVEVGAYPDILIAHADHALYAAKNEGKNRYAAHSSAPSVAPEIDDMTVLKVPAPDMASRSAAGD